MSPSPGPNIICATGAVLSRRESDFVLGPLNWQMREGQFWAVVGPGGSGKTTLAEGLLGRHRLNQGSLRWPDLETHKDDQGRSPWPSEVSLLVGFREESRDFSYTGLYYQQRFEFAEEAKSPRVGDFVTQHSRHGEAATRELLKRWGLDRLRDQPLITLSHGETRKARLARAYLSRPYILILDDPLAGLDAASREDLGGLLGEWFAEGARILLLSRGDNLPERITHILDLSDPGNPRTTDPATWKSRAQPGGLPTRDGRSPLDLASEKPQTIRGPEIVGLEQVTIKMGARTLLDRVDWNVHQGERWHLAGPNGAGKSTLLSLLCGDHPQAFSNTVRLFGQQRGTGETLWDIKKRVGLVSPELHHYFQEPLTALETILTGFFDVMARRSGSDDQIKKAQQWLEELGLAQWADRPFRQLSTCAQKRVLLARALIKNPPLVILDEPFQGMDEESIRRCQAVLDKTLTPEQALIFVSHVPSEAPRFLQRRLVLDQGRVVERV